MELPQIDPYGVMEASCAGPVLYRKAACNACGGSELVTMLCEYHWHGGLWRIQVVTCSDGHVVFRSRPERV